MDRARRGADRASKFPSSCARWSRRSRSRRGRTQKVDKRSGVSQRLPISLLENVVSNAERRALLAGETIAVPRITDIYAALPAITGKFELEYEGELNGADNVAREMIRSGGRQSSSTAGSPTPTCGR